MVATTDRKKGALRKIADEAGLASFEVPDGVGGRFSVLTPVGLLPAALLGIDIRGLLAGAAAMDARLASAELIENPAYLGAVLHRAAYAEGRRISVMFAYSDQLYLLADWYRQLWAESLGKRFGLDGTVAAVGPTPVKALGVTDQHSQVQLYKEGPDDKVYTFLGVERFARTVPIPPAGKGLDAISYLGGHTLNELLAAEQRATEAALSRAGRPVTRITFPEVTRGERGGVLPPPGGHHGGGGGAVRDRSPRPARGGGGEAVRLRPHGAPGLRGKAPGARRRGARGPAPAVPGPRKCLT